MISYALPNQGRLVLSDEVLSTFDGYRQVNTQNEAGGQLFAKLDSTPNLAIVHATGPSDRDRRSRFRFIPNRWIEQRAINQLHRSGLHYVGDWHTHPQAIPQPSATDIASITDCYNESRKSIGGFILLIVGREHFPQGLFVGVTDGKRFSAISLQQCEKLL